MNLGRAYFAVQAVTGAAWWVAVFDSPFVRHATLGDLQPVAVAAFDIPLFVGASALSALGIRPASAVATAWTLLVAIGLSVYATLTTQAGWGALLMIAAAAASVIALCLVRFGRIPTERITVGPFAFRPAATRRTTGHHVATTFAQIAVFWGLFLLVIPVVIDFFERRWNLAVPFPTFAASAGIVLLLLASSLGIASAITMSTHGDGNPLPAAMPNQLVVAGPYRWVRNPMAVAGIAQGTAVGLILPSWLVIVYAVAGSVVWNYAVRPLEEADLEHRFGDPFRQYRIAVRCWVPRLPRRSRADGA